MSVQSLVGSEATHEETFGYDDVVDFAELSGDDNPIHLLSEAGEESVFGDNVCHGMLVASTISAALAKLPGTVILCDQQLAYSSPVYLDSQVEATAVIEEDLGSNRYLVDTIVECDGCDVISGSATVFIEEDT